MKTTISTGGFDYKGLDASARGFVLERAESIHQLARRTAQGIVQIGQYLTEVRDRLGHGNFLPWVEQEFAWTRHTAERFMNVYDQFKLRNLRNLEIDVSALYLRDQEVWQRIGFPGPSVESGGYPDFAEPQA